MNTLTLTVRKYLDVVYAPSGTPGLGDMLGMIERSRFNGETRYTPLNLEMEPLADIQLTAEQTWSLLRGGTMHVDGKQTDHLERVGKQMVNESLSVPGSLIRDVEYGDRVKVGEQWARETAPGWDTYEARRTNTGGVSVIVRKWIG
jgi:hypothetical protein